MIIIVFLLPRGTWRSCGGRTGSQRPARAPRRAAAPPGPAPLIYMDCVCECWGARERPGRVEVSDVFYHIHTCIHIHTQTKIAQARSTPSLLPGRYPPIRSAPSVCSDRFCTTSARPVWAASAWIMVVFPQLLVYVVWVLLGCGVVNILWWCVW